MVILSLGINFQILNLVDLGGDVGAFAPLFFAQNILKVKLRPNSFYLRILYK